MIIYGGELVASGSSTVIPVTGFAVTGSNTFQGNQTINGDITVTGSLTAQQFIVSSSVTYMTTSFASGSTKFGNSLDDTHQFTGSMLLTGSLTVVTNGNEFQVNSDGVNIGNALTDNHVISGSVRINPNGLFVSSSGNLGIGVTNPASKLHVVGDITQQTSLNASAQFFIIARKSRGTVDTPLTVNVGDEAGGIMFQGYDGTSWRSGAVIRAKIQSVSTGVISSDLEFYAGNGSPSVGSLAIVIKGDTRNVGIGSSTAPVYKLEVSTASGSERIRVGTLQNNSNTATFEAITSAGTTTATSGWIRAVYGGGLAVGTSTYTKANGDSGNFANLSSEVQTTAFTVNGGSMYMTKNNIIGTNTSDGSDDGYLFLSSAGAAGASRGAFVQCFGNEYSGDSGVLQLCAGDASSVGYINFRTGNGNDRMRISYNGSIGAPTGTNIYNPSDIRLKQNISTTTYGLNTISLLNPVKFNWVDGFESSEDGKDMLGFVAQEVFEVVPEAIESFGGDINLNGTLIDNPLRVNEKFLIPVLTKAIQEQQAIIDSLIARIEALENN